MNNLDLYKQHLAACRERHLNPITNALECNLCPQTEDIKVYITLCVERLLELDASGKFCKEALENAIQALQTRKNVNTDAELWQQAIRDAIQDIVSENIQLDPTQHLG